MSSQYHSLRDFVIEGKPIAHGGYGDVFKAFDKINKKFVAIKRIQYTDETTKTRASREIQFHRTLDHPNVIKLLYYCDDGNYIYLVMEYAANGDLRGLLERSYRQIPIDEVRRLSYELFCAIEYITSKGIIHHDLKPANCLLDQHNHIKVTDFGQSVWSPDVPIKKSTISGTALYFAPETIDQSENSSLATNVFQYGLIVFEMLTGETILSMSGGLKNYFSKLASGKYNINLNDPDAYDLLHRCLEKDVSKRVKCSQLVDHPFFHPPIKFTPHPRKEPLHCPFKGGFVDVLADGTLVLDIVDSSKVFEIAPDHQKMRITTKDKRKSNIYQIATLPPKYKKKADFAIRISQEASKKKPLVIWNTPNGRFALLEDYQITVLKRNSLVPARGTEAELLRATMISLVETVLKSPYPIFPILVGRSTDS